MKKLRLVFAFALVLFLCACSGNNNLATLPTTPSQTASQPPAVDSCSGAHDFSENSDACAQCGIDYFSATLTFELAATRDYYTLVGIGKCDRTEIVVPATYHGLPVKKIGNGALAYYYPQAGVPMSNSFQKHCRNITKIVLPDTVTEIGEHAFQECTALREINLPDGITAISRFTFSGCKSLERIHLPQGIESIGERSFSDCQELKELVFPDGLKTIGDNAFSASGITGLVNIPDTVTELGKGAFLSCWSMEGVRLPDGISVIQYEAFMGCRGLKNVVFGSNVTRIGQRAFSGTGLESITVPETVTAIEYGAFRSCLSLRSIALPSGLQEISERAFQECDMLEYTVYEGANYLGNPENPYLVLVALPNSSVTDLTVHEDTAFIIAKHTQYGDFHNEPLFPALQTLYIGKSLKTIEFGIFFHAASLASIRVSSENKTLHSPNNCVIDTASKTLILACKTSVIPEDGSVQVIGRAAFGYIMELTGIVIPDTVNMISVNAFMNCPKLEYIVIGSGVKTIYRDVLVNSANIQAIYYHGTAQQWEQIAIDFNRDLENTPLYFYSETQPTEPGNYWHYVDGVPTPWET